MASRLVLASRGLADIASLETCQPSLRFTLCHVQSKEFIFLPGVERSLAKGYSPLLALKVIRDRFAK